MVDVLKVRPRDGCRGGQEQFRWNQVTSQDYKDREQYLGASTKVGMMGKFGQYYLHDWYARKRDTPEQVEDEKESIKAYEEELMQEALGLKPKKLLLQKKQLTEEELKLHLSKEKPEGRRGRTPMGPQGKLTTNEFGEQVVEDDIVGKAYLDTTIKGVGFAAHRNAKLEEYKVQAFGTTTKLEGCIKIEDGDDDVMRFGFGMKNEPGVKNEPVVKQERGLKEEPKMEPKEEPGAGQAAASSSSSSGVRRDAKSEAEVKDEDRSRGEKRGRGDAEEGDPAPEAEGARDPKAAKKAAKEEKKKRKAEKKQKKLTKKLKKAAKKAKKAQKTAKKAKKKDASGSSDSSSSSSS
eukprot:TRINITY_DN40888_c0_g1_i1.p1 TRINITY_DN40888_c0_g1~~TRINITY_DN40888_c0_g1_i1.p1  ORF type:complete len:377 (+),score=123.46 TRINITY_DN40888_c0_g1_i1:85-1131(+)